MNTPRIKPVERDTIILPMDGLTKDEALAVADELQDGVWGVKIHHQYDRYGAGLTKEFKDRTLRVMADLKLKDIPETVKNRGLEYVKEGVDYLTLHASGGVAMMQMLVEAIEGNPSYRTQLLAISVLTSLKAEACLRSYGDMPNEKVREFALMAVEAGVPGLVLSPKEVALINESKLTKGLIKVTPGIRMPGADKQDQERVDAPYPTILGGANQLVIGRPILKPENGMTRREAMEMFVAEIARAWAEIKHKESEKFLKLFADAKALWLDREMVSPVHAKLASGLHSNAFFNTTKVIENPRLLEAAVKSRSLNLKKYGRVDWVVGSAMGGISIAHEVARELGARSAFTEKLEMLDARERIPLVNFLASVKEGKSGEMPREISQILERLDKMTDSEKMVLKRFEEIKAGDRVLLCEDVIMTGGTTAATKKLLEEKGCEVIPEVVAVCDRSDKTSERYALGDTGVNSLIQLNLPTHEPDNCPMCAKGSEADSVKKRWAELKQS